MQGSGPTQHPAECTARVGKSLTPQGIWLHQAEQDRGTDQFGTDHAAGEEQHCLSGTERCHRWAQDTLRFCHLFGSVGFARSYMRLELWATGIEE